MSNQQQKQAATLPAPEAAFDLLATNVHQQAFFGHLAQRGYQPSSVKEAQDLLEMAGELRVAREDPQVKAASEPNAFAQARQDLLGVLGKNGGKVAADQHEQAVNAAALELAAYPELYNSVLALKQAEAIETAKAMGL